MMDHMPGSSPSRVALSGIFFALATFGGDAAAQSQRGFYYSTSVGVASGASTVARLTGANHPTRCDRLLYADPNDAPTGPECQSTALDFVFTFEPESGLGGSAVVGYALGALALELEAVQRHQIVHEAPLTLGAGAGAAITGKDTEWSTGLPPWGDLSEFRSRQLFVNAHYRLASGSRFTPYLGVGGGLARTDYRFYLGLLRKSIAEGYLEVFGGSSQNPEASPEWQRRAAGSLSQLDARVSDTGIGFQVLGGIEVGYSERVSFDLRARWVRVPEVDMDQRWLTIRSHAPVHSDGTTPFVSHLNFSELGCIGITAGVLFRP